VNEEKAKCQEADSKDQEITHYQTCIVEKSRGAADDCAVVSLHSQSSSPHDTLPCVLSVAGEISDYLSSR